MKIRSFFILCLLCSGCVKFQYASIRSTLQHEGHEELSFENDSLKINYKFSGLNGPVEITIHNKLPIPLYVDWSKSALIIGNRSKSYGNQPDALRASLNTDEIKWTRSVSSSSGTINGTITHQEGIGFIPPHSSIHESRISLRSKFFNLPPVTRGNRKTVNNIPVKFFTYDSLSSPLKFRSFLTVSATSSIDHPVYFDHSFWVSEIIKTNSTPGNFISSDNQFYVSKATGFGTFLGVTAITGVVLVAANLENNQ